MYFQRDERKWRVKYPLEIASNAAWAMMRDYEGSNTSTWHW
jgi:hypothetical protein